MIPEELTPIECIDIHVDMVRALRTSGGEAVVRGLTESTPSGSSVLADVLAEVMDRSDTFMVAADMLHIAGGASVDLEAMPLFPQDLPSKNMLVFMDDVGWDYFSYALNPGEDEDVLGLASVRAMSIIDTREMPGGQDGVECTNPDTGELEHRHGVMVMLWADADDVAQKAFDRGIIPKPRLGYSVGGLFPIDVTGWTYGLAWETLSVEDTIAFTGQIQDMPGKVASHVGEMRRQILSMLLLMNEEIYSERERLGDRPARRRWERSSLKTPEDFSIGVTRLRRYHHSESEQHEDSEPYHTHRWYVRGHWRRLHKGTPQEKAVWVRAYIKGPEHAPLIERFRVTSLDR